MPVTLGGMSSGLDTDSIIQKLVEVEARPIHQWSGERENYIRRKDALGDLKSNLTKLNESAKDLYGFRASYNDKKAVSSNQSVLEATANKIAEKGIKEIKVKELASNHKISTDKISKDEKLPSAKFQIMVNGESQAISFKGGTVERLRDRIGEVASELVSTGYVKTDGNNYILTIESKTPGKKGEIILTGDKDFLKKIGMVKGERGEDQDKTKLVFDRKYFSSYSGEREVPSEDGSLDVAKDGNSIKIDGLLWRELALPISAVIKKDTVLEVNIDYQKEAVEEETIPFRMEIGPDEEITIKGIKLKGYNVSRIRPIEKTDDKKKDTDVTGIGIVAVDGDKRIEKIYERGKDVKGKQVLPIGNDFDGKTVSKIIFYCNDGSAKFSAANIMTPIKGTGVLEPKNIVKNAADAKIELDGIEIVRDRNNNLNDIIKGVDLTLKRSSDDPVILKIEPDLDKAVDKIKNFVKAYNDYLDLNVKLTKTAKINKPDNYGKSKREIGLFVGDMTILRLENTLKTAVGEAYPSRSENPIKILVQTGISTGAINANWESIKEGKLVIDEDKLRSTIDNNAEGITEFFGSDTDGDNRIDNGMAYRIESYLRPYLMSGRSVLAAKIDVENEAIKSTDDRIDRHKDHLKKYEEKLRTKFASMERSITESKSQGNWLKMNLGIQDSDSGTKKK
ncbi:MAG: flagellar filament capping protein FliD [Spirochaetes bacterium]|nr:flagellar filament capping protein FliD [Spirochaetota bacterium]